MVMFPNVISPEVHATLGACGGCHVGGLTWEAVKAIMLEIYRTSLSNHSAIARVQARKQGLQEPVTAYTKGNNNLKTVASYASSHSFLSSVSDESDESDESSFGYRIPYLFAYF